MPPARLWKSSPPPGKIDEQALQLALSRLEGVELGGSDRNQNNDSWVFTQLARASTELSAMLIEAMSPGEKPVASK